MYSLVPKGNSMSKKLAENETVVSKTSDGDLSIFFRFVPPTLGKPDTGSDDLIQKLNKQASFIPTERLSLTYPSY